MFTRLWALQTGLSARSDGSMHLAKEESCILVGKCIAHFALLFAALAGQAALVKAAGISSVTSGSYDLRTPPTTPAGQTWYYGSGMTFQLDATTAGMLADIRRDGTPYNDYEAGTDLIKFSSMTAVLNPAGAVPLSRPTTETTPGTGVLSSTSVYPMYGGFVPRGAAITGGAAHPHGGTGFGMKLIGFYPANTSQSFPDPCTYRLELQQLSYNGSQFTSSVPVRMSSAGLRVGTTSWYITAPGFSPAIPDGNDLLFPVLCSNGDNGIARFQHGANGWQPTSFVPITDSGSEPSLIRDTDGSLLFTNRDASVYRLWKAASPTGTWNKVLEQGTRLQTPVVLCQAADGTPYFTGNPSSSQPARNTLQITPVNSARNGLGSAITVLDGYAEFGASPSGQGWDVDHGYGNVLRLADGQWHSILVHRVLARTEHFNASLGTPYTGLYMEEVFSSGAARPMWTFVAPEPSSGILVVSAIASILGARYFWSRRNPLRGN
jgi:hypothetical protein